MYNKNFIVICISSTIAAFPPMAVVLLGGIITSQIMMKDSLATVPMTLMIIGIAIGAPIAMPIIINVIGTVANEPFIIIWDVIIPPNNTTAIGGKAAIVEEIQITIKFLLYIK